MGSNCNVWLPTDVTGNRVAEVVGILAGLPSKKYVSSRDAWWAEVVGAEEKPTSVSTMSDIVLHARGEGTLVDGESGHFAHLHYCSRRDGRIYNCFAPKSTPFWCAVAVGLAKWFGGTVEFNDCGGGRKNVRTFKRSCPVDKHGLIPDDGEPWNKYHGELLALKAVTEKEIRAVAKLSAYPELVKFVELVH